MVSSENFFFCDFTYFQNYSSSQSKEEIFLKKEKKIDADLLGIQDFDNFIRTLNSG